MRFDLSGLFWDDPIPVPGQRVLGPLPPIPETNWRPPNASDLPDLRGAPVIAFDCETKDPELTDFGPGWARGRGHIVGFSMAVQNGPKLYIPIRHEVQSELNMDAEKMLQYAQHCLGGPGDKVGANLLYDFGWFRQEGVHVGGRLLDVQYAEALINSTTKLGLEEIATKYTGVGKSVDLLKDWCQSYYRTGEKTWRKDIYRAPVTLVGAYAERDATAPLEVMPKQMAVLAEQGLMNLFYLECRLIRLLCDMRFAGVSVDVSYTEQLRDSYLQRIAALEEEIRNFVGFYVNVNSGQDLGRAFDVLGVPYERTARGEPSFVKEWLEHHPHPFAKLVNDVRGLKKLVSTFLESYILSGQINGKVYGSFNPVSSDAGGARTGRFSSSGGLNLQNIPSRTADGKAIRRAFIPDAGHVYWEKIDYSQIEYRFLAHFATGEGADNLRATYNANPHTDYHDSTAALIKTQTGIELIRSYVKNINFGIVYGMGIDHLAHSLGVPKDKAVELLDAYHAGAPFAKSTMDDCSDFANRHGYITTILGRRNYFDQWEPGGRRKGPAFDYHKARAIYGDNIQRAYLYRALNYRLQGSSADQMKSAMVTCYESGVFDVTGVPRLTVHDELDWSIPEPCDAAMEYIVNTMQNVIPLRIPVVAERDRGPNWGDVVSIEKWKAAA